MLPRPEPSIGVRTAVFYIDILIMLYIHTISTRPWQEYILLWCFFPINSLFMHCKFTSHSTDQVASCKNWSRSLVMAEGSVLAEDQRQPWKSENMSVRIGTWYLWQLYQTELKAGILYRKLFLSSCWWNRVITCWCIQRRAPCEHSSYSCSNILLLVKFI